jgi:Arc/MetJ-type ribon-helix-helix transcriptional regulator
MDKRFNFRVSDQMYQQVHEAIKKGVAKTPSELIRLALEQFLQKN